MELHNFEFQTKELYKFQSKNELVQNFSVIKQDRKSIVLYDFGQVKWIVMPKQEDDITLDKVELFTKRDSSRIMFLDRENENIIIHEDICRLLTNNDIEKFEEFEKSCPKADKSEGMVSLSDPIAYGCFVDDILVSMTSLWNWGDKLSDIGVLSHPDYRKHGYAESVVRTLMKNTDKVFIWRCDIENAQSYKLALKLGFKDAGMIYVLSN